MSVKGEVKREEIMVVRTRLGGFGWDSVRIILRLQGREGEREQEVTRN